MNLIISALHFDWTSLDDCLGRVRGDLALDGVELSWTDAFARPHCTREDFERLHALRGTHGLRLSAHIWDDLPALGPELGEQSMQRWLSLAEHTGISQLVVHGGTHADREAGLDVVRGVLARVLPDYERAGVVINLENHYAWDYHDGHELFSEPWEFMSVLRFDSPSLRFCFDTGHGHMTRNTTALVRELGPWLGYVHLSDNHGVNDDHCMLGQGSIDWEPLWSLFHAVGFDGTFCVEFPVRHDRGPFDYTARTLRRRWSKK